MKYAGMGPTRTHQQRSIVLGLLVAVMLAIGLGIPKAIARPTEPSRTDRTIALLVSALLDRKHLSEMHLNDEISQRAFDKFFDQLDRLKLFFFQSDLDDFADQRNSIDDQLKNGNVQLAHDIFDRFLQRVRERVDVALRLLEEDFDFTVDEQMVRDPDELEYTQSEAELDERWRKRVKYDLMLELVDDTEYSEAIEKLRKRYRGMLKSRQQTDNDELLEDFLSAVALSFDPHSSYLSPSTLENFTIQMRLELNGIGASLESKYGETIVRRIVPGGAADKDGRLKINDVIVGVAEGKEGEFVDIVDMKINDVVQLIRGEPGTVVRLEVSPADKSGRIVYDITRARIELKDSEARSKILERPIKKEAPTTNDAELEDPNSVKAEGPEGSIVEQQAIEGGPVHRIGVISLPSFYMDMEGRRAGKANYKSTTRDLRRLLEKFNQQNVDLVILDLRFNGGGSLPESVETTGLFIDKGPVVQVKGPDGRIQPYADDDSGMVWSGPLIVLVNHFSASASEILAGAIQDYGRGIIIGDHSTHGKGTVQQLFELGSQILPLQRAPNYGALKLTIQKFYRPGGDSTQSRGVVSDIELPYRTSYWEGISEADLDYALDFDRVAPLPHENYRSASPSIIQELQKRSSKRISQTEFFIKEQRKIEQLIKRQQDPKVTLNLEKYQSEREEVNSEKDQEEMMDSLQNNDRPVFKSTPYNEEVLAIAKDYLELLGDDRIAVAR